MEPHKEGAVLALLRIGVAFSFIYPAISAFVNPDVWIGYFPLIIQDLFGGNDVLLLSLFGITEIVLALWILVGKRIFVPSVIASIYLIAIVLFNLSALDIVFRDISILVMALALAYAARRDSSRAAHDPTTLHNAPGTS